MGEGLGVEIAPDLLTAAQYVEGWELTQTSTPSGLPNILTGSIATDLPSVKEAAQLKEGGYLACQRGRDGDTAIFLTDGYVLFRHGEKDAYVGHYPGQEHPPVEALEAALFRALLSQNVLLVHALVFKYRGKGFMALGESGAGKTTLALAALAAGAEIVSDDRVAIRAEDDAIKAYGMRPYLQIRPASLRCIENSGELAALGIPTAATSVTRLEHALLPGFVIDNTSIDCTLLLQNPTPRQRPASAIMEAVSAAEILVAAIAGSLPYIYSMNPAALSAEPYNITNGLLTVPHTARLITGGDLMCRPAEAFVHLLDNLQSHPQKA